MEAPKLLNVSVETYLRLEQENDERYEYHDGQIAAMAGGTIRHATISGNIFGELRNSLRGSSCQAFSSEIRLAISQQRKYLYPDAMVVCGELVRDETISESITNQTVIFEVLSKTTESYDRGDKFHFYQQIPSLQAYVLVSQDRMEADVFQRRNDFWQYTRVRGAKSVLALACLEVEIPLEQLYENVAFDAPTP